MTTPESDPLAALRRELDLLDEWHIVDAAKLAVMRIPDGQLLDFRMWVGNEPERRVKERVAAEVRDETAAQLIGELVDAGTITGPESTTAEEYNTSGTAPAWINPGTDHAAMYRLGAIVEHGGKHWQSTHPGLNSWEPGAQGVYTWIELAPPAPEGEPETVPEFVQPTGAHDTYPKGAQVRFEGAVYESLLDNNAYSPTAYPAGWKKL